MNRSELFACHECDLLQRLPQVSPGGVLRCRRCNAELYRNRINGLAHALAFSIASMVLIVISNLYPIVGLSINGTVVQTTLGGAVRVLYLDGMWPLAGLVFATTILMPVVQTASMLWILLPLSVNRIPWHTAMVFRLYHLAGPWTMTEVLILGLLVALVKLAHIASVAVGVALWSFGALMLVLAAAAAAFEPRDLWSRVTAERDTVDAGQAREPAPCDAVTAAQHGLALCHDCGLLARVPAHGQNLSCPRCGASLHMRTPNSLSRTWALLIAATVLYIPANVLPVMNTSSLFGAQKDTIMSGVAYLWTSGSWLLAAIVFIASVAVPMLKILALAYLTASTQLQSKRLPEQRTRIYRAVEFVGRWSMLDIYVITMLVALVQFKSLATIEAGPAAIAFGAVVVLTMFAAMTFDPRLIWDAAECDHARS
ncbi:MULTISPECIES: paraquat-inducible protein A [Paraburkholderia]|uniref:Paraquat-inducible protein A n=2 Tax=Paraburkholderia hospita TaxID=169430 RepID=A0AAJ4VXR4_9BURK|nr:paraquat-inducible protein A [Paraburkholderia hospita]AUT69104.1 paraquat-inducible protein A [Paraburkholderia hospita]AXE99238.1 paraquat-inducible protein A [Paraburkholderia hospita]OUL85148.1 paraquat-inducible protein A [Paraburkholderia hospita]OUL93327.1 paraquat-inducible protein A [Paraburkholderia hospita]OUL97343.1 paraquat-inducible protein A [Paraburkholderia hospita]